ncbi:MAG: hypothetical protein GWN58_63075, partial [Anaerolineae bacterium]|nr:hypothetical protein [Anaerolineae bacterium]
QLFAIAVLVLVLVLVLQVVSFAIIPPPPPPEEPADCSPGFWKNHTELWWADYPNPDYPTWQPEWMLAALQAKGNSDLRPFRVVVA